MAIIKVLTLLCVLCITNSCFSQIVSDTIVHPMESDTINVEKGETKIANFFRIFSGKPGRAALLSLVIPGGGQIYNKKYWKAPIAWGLDGYFLYRRIYFARLHSKFELNYTRVLKGELDTYRGFNAAKTKSLRDRFLLLKEKYSVYFGISHLVSVIDAFVDRHLMEFDMSEDLTIDVIQEIITPDYEPIDYVGLQLMYRF